MKKYSIAFFLAFFCLGEAIAQSPWNQNRGKGFFKLS